MKIALCGTDEESLNLHKRKIKKYIRDVDDKSEITCIKNEEVDERDMREYQMILVGEAAFSEFEEIVNRKNERRRIALSVGKELNTFFVEDIYYVEAELSKVHLMTRDGEFILPISISQMETMLEQEGFIKVHRSYLVNKVHVVRIKHRTVYMDNEKEIPISKYRIKDVRERMGGA